jgi:hypothetical protein
MEDRKCSWAYRSGSKEEKETAPIEAAYLRVLCARVLFAPYRKQFFSFIVGFINRTSIRVAVFSI